jgi:hypothetical protein
MQGKKVLLEGEDGGEMDCGRKISRCIYPVAGNSPIHGALIRVPVFARA